MAANLFVNRLYVLTEGEHVAYDEQFQLRAWATKLVYSPPRA